VLIYVTSSKPLLSGGHSKKKLNGLADVECSAPTLVRTQSILLQLILTAPCLSLQVKALIQTIETSGNVHHPDNKHSNTGSNKMAHSASTPAVRTNPATEQTSAGAKKANKPRAEPVVTYLNVHAGVSMGVMAGLDVGAADRFEVPFACVYLVRYMAWDDVHAVRYGAVDGRSFFRSCSLENMLYVAE
jgi:hypothetical protein